MQRSAFLCVLPKTHVHTLASMFFRLLLLFVAVPALELYVLVQIGERIGLLATIGLILFTGFLGSALLRQQGMVVWKRFNDRLATGQLPSNELVEALIVLVSGALLLTPGVLTDFVGFLGLVPGTRSGLRIFLQRWFKRLQAQGKVRVFTPFTTQTGGFQGFTPPPTEPASDQDNWGGQAQQRPDHLGA